VGGHQYTDSLQKELDLSFDDAEALKLGHKVGTVSEDAKTPVLQQVTEIIVLEIQKTFDFFRATASGENIRRIVVAGGTARVPGLLDLLKEEFAMPVGSFTRFAESQSIPDITTKISFGSWRRAWLSLWAWHSGVLTRHDPH
jgi:type IV pilus assembly protein PilM